MLPLDEATPHLIRREQAHFLSHLPKKNIMHYFDIVNDTHAFNVSEMNFSSRSWMNSLSGSIDVTNPWSVAYFERLSRSFVRHESEPGLFRRIADGVRYERIVIDLARDKLNSNERAHKHDRAATLLPELAF